MDNDKNLKIALYGMFICGVLFGSYIILSVVIGNPLSLFILILSGLNIIVLSTCLFKVGMMQL